MKASFFGTREIRHDGSEEWRTIAHALGWTGPVLGVLSGPVLLALRRFEGLILGARRAMDSLHKATAQSYGQSPQMQERARGSIPSLPGSMSTIDPNVRSRHEAGGL